MMGKRTMCIVVVWALAAALAVPAGAQSTPQPAPQPSPLPLPPAVEKELAARASNVTEVTLGKSMLGFAAKFMDSKDKDEAATRQLIENLDGIYVRDYEFDKDGQYSMDEIEKLRTYFETPEWSPIVRSYERRTGERTDVLVKNVNGETKGMFILSAEPRELSIVLILGPVRMEDIGRLRGIGGLSGLGAIEGVPQSKEKTKDKDKDKDKTKGGTE